MSGENWRGSSTEDSESDGTDGTTSEQAAKRRASLAKLVAGSRRGGVGEASRNTNTSRDSELLGSFVVGRRPAQGVESPLADTSKERDSVAEHTAASELPKHEPGTAEQPAVESQVPEASQAETTEQLASLPVVEVEPSADTAAPAEARPLEAPQAELLPAPEQETPKTAEQALVMWARELSQEQEREPQPQEDHLYEGEALWTRVPAQRDAEIQPAPQDDVTGEAAYESAPVPTVADLEEATGVDSYAALQPRVVRPAGSRRRPQPSRPFTASTPSGYNTPNTPPNPNAGSGNNMNTPPPPPGGPPGSPPSPGMNPNSGGNWNPAQTWRQTAPGSAPNLVGNALTPIPVRPVEATRSNTGLAFVAGVITGRLFFSGRRKLRREMRQGLQKRDRQIARMEANQQSAQAEHSSQQARAAEEQGRLSRDLGTTQRRLGEVERQHHELETQHVGLAQQVETDQRKDNEKRREAEKGVKARAAQQIRSAKVRLERFRNVTERPEPGLTIAEGRPVAKEGNRFERSGWVTNEVDAQGRVVNEAESTIKHGQAFHQERSVERGLGVKSQAVGEVVLLAGGTASRQQGGTAGSNASGTQPHTTGVVPVDSAQPDVPSMQPQSSLYPDIPHDLVAGRKQTASAIWPYMLALVVILICLIALLR